MTETRKVVAGEDLHSGAVFIGSDGKAYQSQPADLAREAEVTPRDKALAPRFWAHYATPLLKRLLNARTRESA